MASEAGGTGASSHAAGEHPFVRAPHRTLLALSLPVLFSLVAEPLTGLADTAFVARLGASGLAALGVGTTALTSLFWAFNFLQIGTQTEVAQHYGSGDYREAARVSGLALTLSALFGLLIIAVALPALPWIATAMGATGEVHALSMRYMQVRAFGAPAILLMIACFGALRGVQDMRTPLWVAIGVNVLNVALDALLIFGLGPLPPLGIAGAALASVVSQWLGALWGVYAVFQRLGAPARPRARDAGKLLQVGGDLFLRTGLLTLFLLLTTRTATQIGPSAGAAHQAIRQLWVFAALFLDSFAITGQSLVGYFVGASRLAQARRVAAVVCGWSLGAGAALGLAMWLGQDAIAGLLVPDSALGIFAPAWVVAAAIQPLNALTFAADGIHWGTGDYRFLRNAMLVATLCGSLALLLIDESAPRALLWIWAITGLWSGIRAAFGMARIWPGIWGAPLAPARSTAT